MPELSRFFGIIIRMYMEAGDQHITPHFHKYYQDEVAVFTIEEIELIACSFPKRQKRFVEAWVNCIKMNYLKTGIFCKNGDCHFQ
jgi:Domain of unknown function (DUF4160)